MPFGVATPTSAQGADQFGVQTSAPAVVKGASAGALQNFSDSGAYSELNPITAGQAKLAQAQGENTNEFGVNTGYTQQIGSGPSWGGGFVNNSQAVANQENKGIQANTLARQTNAVASMQLPNPAQESSGGSINWSKALPGAQQAASSTWGKQVNAAMASGNYSQALQIAQQNGGLKYLLHPATNSYFGAGNLKTQQQYDSFYQAFAPYEAQMQGQASGGQGREGSGDLSTVYGKQTGSQDVSNANTDFSSKAGLDPARFDATDSADQNINTQFGIGAAETALSVFAAPMISELGPILAGATGLPNAAGGAIVGGAIGAGKSDLSGGNVLEGTALGALGGGLADGGAQAISGATGGAIGPTAINVGARALSGGLTGGLTGALVGGAGAAAGSTGVPGAGAIAGLAGNLITQKYGTQNKAQVSPAMQQYQAQRQAQQAKAIQMRRYRTARAARYA